MPTLPWTAVAELDPQHEYDVVATRFVVTHRYRIPHVLRSAQMMLSALSSAQGLLGYTFQSSISNRTLATLTVWHDRPSMHAFVRSQPHIEAMKSTRPWMADSRFSYWTAAADQLPPTWRTATERLNSQPS
jgi:heme-degrading monooxygenase HmoA